MNYNEGFNTKMTDAEISDLGRRHRTDVLLAGMQLNFIADVVRGVGALKPKVVVLYPPHEKFHAYDGCDLRAVARLRRRRTELLPGCHCPSCRAWLRAVAVARRRSSSGSLPRFG